MTRRILSGVLGFAFAFAGLGFFGYWFTAEPGFGPQSTDIAFAYVIFGIALGGSGIWLIRISLRGEDPPKSMKIRVNPRQRS